MFMLQGADSYEAALETRIYVPYLGVLQLSTKTPKSPDAAEDEPAISQRAFSRNPPSHHNAGCQPSNSISKPHNSSKGLKIKIQSHRNFPSVTALVANRSSSDHQTSRPGPLDSGSLGRSCASVIHPRLE